MNNLLRLKEQCLFCDPSAHGQAEQVLLRSDNFYLFAGLGPIVDGYIIVAPYRCDDPDSPLHSFSEIPVTLLDEVFYLQSLVSEFYREVYAQEASMQFEHGRAGVCYPRSSDTRHCYHAHLCCYPRSLPLWEDLNEMTVIDIDGLTELKQAVGSRPYLLIQSSFINPLLPEGSALRETWVSKVALLDKERQIPSQYLRRLLAARNGDEYSWDWAASPQWQMVKALVETFRTWLGNKKNYELRMDSDGVNRLDFIKSVEKSNRIGNDNIAEDFHKTWAGHMQYGAIGKFISHLPQNRNNAPKILDLGCGPGHYIKAFYSLGFECVGIDISERMIELAQQVVGGQPNHISPENTSLPRIETTSLFDLPSPSETFDGIWYSAVVVHVPRMVLPDNLVRMRQILKKNGVLYISALIGNGSSVRREGRVFFYYGEEELIGLFKEVGFTVIEKWSDETERNTRGGQRKKNWRHFLLKKEDDPVLSDLGERGVIERILTLTPQSSDEHIHIGIGDDCASIRPIQDEVMVITMDPCPQPVITLLGENDPWYYGWFTMIISLSDLGAMGAKPLGVLLALEAENDMKVVDLDRFYEGINEAAKEFGCPVIGGNVKDAARFSCVSTALGSVHPGRMLRRNAAQPGDLVVVLGDMGIFWAGIIYKLESLSLSPEESNTLLRNLRRPRPRIFEGRAVAEHGLAHCAMDSSDGLAACFYEIAKSSNVDIHLNFTGCQPHPLVSQVAEIAGIDFRKLMLSWGDWELVITVPETNLDKLQQVMDDLNCPVAVVGKVAGGRGDVWFHDTTNLKRLNYVSSERFTKRSYFSHGLESYLQIMRREPISL
jgi:thiamine-monophosphate kinase